MLTTLPLSDEFDLQPWVGQRSKSFTFQRVNGLTGENLGFITPLRSGTLSHDVNRTIKRQLTLDLGAEDSATIEPLTDRILVSMVDSSGTLWPLGKYMFTDDTERSSTGGTLSNVVLNDEMFLVDQGILTGIDASTQPIVVTVQAVMDELKIPLIIEPSPFLSTQSWSAGAKRGGILQSLAVAGDYFSPWFANDTKFHMIRSFDPIDAVPQFDWDAGNQVVRDTIVNSNNLLTAPNRFLVISNTGAQTAPVTAVATVPPNAPHSFANRGFYITEQQTLQLVDVSHAAAVANNLANRMTVFDTVNLSTVLDPRHDAYDVVHWQGSLWLELAWAMELRAGGAMTHMLRKAYAR